MVYVKGLLSKNEQIIVHVRKHWIVLAGSFLCNLFFVILIAAVAVTLASENNPLAPPVLSLGVFPICFFAYSYLKWLNEEYFVTNRRVIQSEGIVNKRVIDSSLEKVNDVVLSQSWIGRMMDFGDVEIMTASEIGVNNLTMIRHPVRFKTEMLNQKESLGMDEHYSGSRSSAAGRKKGDIPELIAGLEQLWKEGVLTDEEFQEKKTQLLSRV